VLRNSPPTRDGPADRLSSLFATPRWLRELGNLAWLLVGVALAVVGAIWLLSLTYTIVLPVLTAAVVAAVTSPLLRRIVRLGLPRGVAAALVLVGFVVIGAAVVVLILGGIASESDQLRRLLGDAKDTIAGWVNDLGVDSDTAEKAKNDASSAIGDAVPALLKGVSAGLETLSSLVIFLSLTALSLFFLLKDGPVIRRWAERHVRMPTALAHQMGDRVLESLRNYFLGVTFVAAFNAIVVGIGALVLGVPLLGTIMIVTFLGAYVPYLGAWAAGAFSVLLALGGVGPEAAIAMVVIQLMANGLLQQLVQPIAYGAALGIHPLAVLIVTIAGGSLFGAVGLILAAPMTSAATRIAADLRSAPGSPGPDDAPAPAASFDTATAPATK
jgi:putative heme transporter